jgi:hypothetical protein
MANSTCGIAVTPSKLLFDELLDAELDLLCRTVGWRFKACRRGRNSKSSAGSTQILGMIPEDELGRLLVDGEDVSRREGKRAWTICMVRTADMMKAVSWKLSSSM